MERLVEKRPLGSFEQFVTNEVCTVKIITVDPAGALSLQYHHNRYAFWKVLHDKPLIIIRDETINGADGHEFLIPRGTKHRIIADGTAVKLLEISFGSFDEKDIVRLEDKYKRT
jgi:mannose-6-phosphate isomerase-like protein (cupin superfamily)